MDISTFPNSADYIEALNDNNNILIPSLSLNQHYNDTLIYEEGAFCIVFACWINHKKYAIRCWKCLTPKIRKRIERRMKIITQKLHEYQLSYFVDIQYYKEGISTSKGTQPVIIMDWYEDMDLKEYIHRYLHAPKKLFRLLSTFEEMVTILHKNGISHGDLQPNNIRVREDGSLYLIDYDTLYLPCMKHERDDIRGMPEFQHRLRKNNHFLFPQIDYFAEQILYLSILAIAKYPEIWDYLNLPTVKYLLFTKEELYNIQDSRVYSFLKQDKELLFLTEHLLVSWKMNKLENIHPIEKILRNLVS